MTTKGRKLQWKTVRKRGTFRHRARGKEHGARSMGLYSPLCVGMGGLIGHKAHYQNINNVVHCI